MGTFSRWWLDEATLGVLDLHDLAAGSIFVTSFDPGEAAARDNVEQTFGVSGELDLTELHGGRLVTAGLRIVGSPADRQSLSRQIEAFTRPDLRPALYWDRPGVGVRRVVGRVGYRRAIANAGRAFLGQLTVRAGSGLWFADEQQGVTVPAAATATGRTYNLIYDRSYPAGSGITGEGVLIHSAGNALTPPVIRIYGPCVNPDLVLLSDVGSHDGRWSFVGLTLAAGEYVEIDVARRLVTADGLITATRYDKLDLATLAWGLVVPGDNVMSFTVSSGADTNTQAVILWSDADL